MYMTNAVPRNSVVPYWNEIKKMSREDRSNLAELIEMSLDAENTADENSFINQLDDTAMQAAAEFAYQESRSGRTIPHSQVFDIVKEELGWK